MNLSNIQTHYREDTFCVIERPSKPKRVFICWVKEEFCTVCPIGKVEETLNQFLNFKSLIEVEKNTGKILSYQSNSGIHTLPDDRIHPATIVEIGMILNETTRQSFIENYVDLGLPSGKKWAKCNIGAKKETDYGLYYQWGDTVGYEGDEAKAHSTWRTAPFHYGSTEDKDLLSSKIKNEICPNGVLAPQYDAVYQATKGKAYMPTMKDFKELVTNTITSWEENFNGSGVNGRKFTSKKDPTKYIFIPASGYARYGSFDGRGRYGNIWSSSLDSSNTCNAWKLWFSSNDLGINNINRFCGFSVRGVMD